MSQYILSSLTDDEELNFSEEVEVFVFPTSFAQQRLWFLDQLALGNPFYNVSTALRLKGSLNFTALKQTFNEIVRRHETLRTRFVMVEQQPVQAIAAGRFVRFWLKIPRCCFAFEPKIDSITADIEQFTDLAFLETI